jgi:hypothetical protein
MLEKQRLRLELLEQGCDLVNLRDGSTDLLKSAAGI